MVEVASQAAEVENSQQQGQESNDQKESFVAQHGFIKS
jgi:hypothetical protein